MEKRPKIGDYITGVESLSDDPIDHKKWSVALNKYIDDLESRLAEEKERAKFIRNQNIDLVQACEELRKRLKEAEAKVEGYECDSY